MSKQQQLTPTSTGYADAAEGLRVYYEIYGKGEPIVVLAGGFGDVSSMTQTIGPLSRERQVIGIDLEGHGRTALRATPMSHERNGDDVAAVLRHLKIAKADVAGYSHGGDAAIRMAIQHPEMVRNLIVISTAAERDGWYPEVLKGMEAVSSAQVKQFQQTPFYQALRRSRAASGAIPAVARPHGRADEEGLRLARRDRGAARADAAVVRRP